jgi:hypothetical protein
LGLELTREGLIAIETLFRKFLKYMKKSNSDELGTWINHLELNKNNSLVLIRDSYHFITIESRVGKAFHAYLNDLESLENLTSFKVEEPEPDKGELVDDLFQHIGDINKLFEHKLARKLFCPPPEAHSIMSKAVRGKKVNFTDFIASVALVIDGICHKEIGDLVEPGKASEKSINKIESVFKHNKIQYKPDILAALRAVLTLRNKSLPMHSTGSEEVVQLKKIGLPFPIGNPGEAAYAILQSLNSCLVEMKTWLAVK